MNYGTLAFISFCAMVIMVADMVTKTSNTENKIEETARIQADTVNCELKELMK